MFGVNVHHSRKFRNRDLIAANVCQITDAEYGQVGQFKSVSGQGYWNKYIRKFETLES